MEQIILLLVLIMIAGILSRIEKLEQFKRQYRATAGQGTGTCKEISHEYLNGKCIFCGIPEK